MKEKIIEFGKWAEENWLALIIILGIVMMIFLCAVMVSWLIGYWSNALWGKHFDLNSCWSGVTVVITGLGGIVALAKAAWTKYGMDSRYNSTAGMPVKGYLKGDIKNVR
ncbi:MAG: hypothetical protein LKI17_06440 [Megasphaera cerevisiae]|jgi:L-asparagine transporter-like permease|nr:hypothetical protein [Megasphaera cerevisiae]